MKIIMVMKDDEDGDDDDDEDDEDEDDEDDQDADDNDNDEDEDDEDDADDAAADDEDEDDEDNQDDEDDEDEEDDEGLFAWARRAQTQHEVRCMSPSLLCTCGPPCSPEPCKHHPLQTFGHGGSINARVQC